MNDCINCGRMFETDDDRHLYCSECLPDNYALSGPLERADLYPEDDESLGTDEEHYEAKDNI